jgi:hypothetical protein
MLEFHEKFPKREHFMFITRTGPAEFGSSIREIIRQRDRFRPSETCGENLIWSVSNQAWFSLGRIGLLPANTPIRRI